MSRTRAIRPQPPHYRHILWPDNDIYGLSPRILELVREQTADLQVVEPRSTRPRRTTSPALKMAEDLPGFRRLIYLGLHGKVVAPNAACARGVYGLHQHRPWENEQPVIFVSSKCIIPCIFLTVASHPENSCHNWQLLVQYSTL
jgi:hypothetical protein